MPKRFAATMRCCARMSDERADRRVDRRRAERPGQLAEPDGQQRVEVDVVVHVVLVRGDVLAVVGCADPHAVQLRDLLVEGHRGDERLDALVDAERRRRATTAIRHRCRSSFERHPFTAPVRPPTIASRRAGRTTSAGIIASDV